MTLSWPLLGNLSQQVDVGLRVVGDGRLDEAMAEQPGDGLEAGILLQHFGRGGVSENMRRPFLVVHSWSRVRTLLCSSSMGRGTYRAGAIALGLGALLACRDGKNMGNNGAPTTLSCDQTLISYCATAQPKCSRVVQLSNLGESFCYGIQTQILVGGAIEPCGSGQIAIVLLPSGDQGTVFLYSSNVDADAPSTYTLTAVIEHPATSDASPIDRCVGGPPSVLFDDSCFLFAEDAFVTFTCQPTGAMPTDGAVEPDALEASTL